MKHAIPTYAGRPERLFAYLIDVLIVALPIAVLTQPFVHPSETAWTVIVDPPAYAVIFLVNLLYQSYFIASQAQATIGMRLLSLYVIRTDGQRLNARDAIERFLAFFMPTLAGYTSFISDHQAPILVFWLKVIWFAPILFRADRAGLHDRLSGTMVLTRERTR
jgi:uncharacterized RDD family membrane protein YckC